MGINEINVANLAYIGDAIYELKIRQYLVLNNFGKVNELQKLAVKYVSAQNQSIILDYIEGLNILTEEEAYTVSRSRNYKPKSKPKHALIKDYKKATALEALFGMLYIKKDDDRINELIDIIIKKTGD